jgi:VWFA-related protein
MPRAAFLTLCSLLLRAQIPPKEVTIRSHPYVPPSTILRAETNLVEAGLTVRDSKGNTIAGLRASDFEILDNGVPQTIAAFSELHSNGNAPPALSAQSEKLPPAAIPPPEPKFVTFFFDDLHGGAGLFVTQAARAFIAKGLKPGDSMSIVTASGQGDLDFTSDATVFAEKLNHLASHERAEVLGKCGVSATDSYIILEKLDGLTIEKGIAAAEPCACGDGEMPGQCRSKALAVAEQMASTAWEQTQAQSINTIAALGFAAKRLSEVNGTRILVMNSTGFLVRPNQPEMQRFIDGAVRWNIVVHAIGAGLGTMGLLHQSLFWMPLEKLTDGTGGHFFKNTNDLAGVMNLAANPEVTYLIAFNPGSHDGQFHTLKIRFKSQRPESVHFRPGYFSPRDEPKLEQSARAPLDDAVFSKETLTDVAAAVSVSPGNASVSVSVIVDLNRMQFTTANGRHNQQIVFLMTLLDPSGAFVTGKEAIMDLALTDEKLASLQKDGLKAVATLTAPAGAYQVRTIVREAMKGNLAASTVPVELH